MNIDARVTAYLPLAVNHLNIDTAFLTFDFCKTCIHCVFEMRNFIVRYGRSKWDQSQNKS